MRSISAAFYPTIKIFSWRFDADYEEVLLQKQIELIDLRCSAHLKSKFLACHIFDFYKNPCFHLDDYPTLSPSPSKQWVCLELHTTEQWFTNMKRDKSTMHSQLPNHLLSDVLRQSTFAFHPNITSFCDYKQHQMSQVEIRIVTYKFSCFSPVIWRLRLKTLLS